MNAVKEKKSRWFQFFIRGVIGFIEWTYKPHRENRLTKPTFEDKEKYWRKQIREQLEQERQEAEAKKAFKKLKEKRKAKPYTNKYLKAV